jgi:hypothetical protein
MIVEARAVARFHNSCALLSVENWKGFSYAIDLLSR